MIKVRTWGHFPQAHHLEVTLVAKSCGASPGLDTPGWPACCRLYWANTVDGTTAGVLVEGQARLHTSRMWIPLFSFFLWWVRDPPGEKSQNTHQPPEKCSVFLLCRGNCAKHTPSRVATSRVFFLNNQPPWTQFTGKGQSNSC